MKWLPGLFALMILTSCQEEQKPRPAPRPVMLPKNSTGLPGDSLNPYAPVDLSPMDISYFPVDYPLHKLSGKTEPPVARVVYSRPHRQGRRIFGSLLKYGEPWRLGANEATEIEFFQPVTIQGTRVPRGRYVIYAIPRPDQWTVVLNTNLHSWGLTPDTARDVYRFEAPVQIIRQPVEFYSMVFQPHNGGADLVMAWDTVVARLSIQTK